MTTLLGASLQRPDAVGKVTGATAYPADLVRPGMLHLKVVFAQRPHARIRCIDPSVALRHPGVVAVLTAAVADPNGPYGARGVAEMALVPLLPAIAGAIHDATGVWVTQQPITPERVLAALNSSQ